MPWSPLPRKVPPTVILPPSVQSRTQAGFVCAVRPLVAALEHCSSWPQPLDWSGQGGEELGEAALGGRGAGGGEIAVVSGGLLGSQV